MNSKWFKGLNKRHDIIELLEEITDKMFSDLNCSDVFLGQFPKAKEIKAKINKWNIIKCKSFCPANQQKAFAHK